MVLTCGCADLTKSASDQMIKDSAGPEYVNLEKDKRIELPFITFEENEQYKQILTADYGGKKNSLLCIVQLSPAGISLTGLTLSSLPLFTLKYENQILTGKYYVPQNMLPPVNQVLFDIMLSFDRKDRLNSYLSKEYIIQREANLAALRRNDGKEIYRIEYTRDKSR